MVVHRDQRRADARDVLDEFEKWLLQERSAQECTAAAYTARVAAFVEWLPAPVEESLRKVTGRTADFPELAQDCVCFANASGGKLIIGIEDGETAPPAGQRIDQALPDRIRRRVCELTVNVQVLPELRRSDTGDEYIVLMIPRSVGVASTSDGRFDSCASSPVNWPAP